MFKVDVTGPAGPCVPVSAVVALVAWKPLADLEAGVIVPLEIPDFSLESM